HLVVTCLGRAWLGTARNSCLQCLANFCRVVASMNGANPSIKGTPYRERSEVQSACAGIPATSARRNCQSSRAPVTRFPNGRRRSQFPYGAGKVKNSHMGGAETAAPGRFFTPRPSKVNRSTLGCWYSVVD